MIPLSTDRYAAVRALTEDFSHLGCLFSVIDGTLPGKVYTDSARAPRAAFVTTPDGMILLGDAGRSSFNHSVSDLFFRKIRPAALQAGEHSYEFFCDDSWEPALYREILTGIRPMRHDIHYYRFSRPSVPDWRGLVPADMALLPIDGRFLGRRHLKNFGEVIQRVDEWGSAANFLQNGFGFCLIDGDVIVSRCMADCVSGSSCEIGIGTDPDYRRRGFAALTVTATVEFCLHRGLEHIGWHASDTNLPSQKTAETCGFERALTYPGYYGCYEPSAHLFEYGMYSIYKRGDYQQAFDCFENLLRSNSLDDERVRRVYDVFLQSRQERFAEQWRTLFKE
jgi:RimJ/RimL family protein N-acetyltransferase